MTRRQIFFFNPQTNTYYISEEFNGDKSEMQRFGTVDRCDKDWDEILEELREISTMDQFLPAISRISDYYHSSLSTSPLPGTRVHVVRLPEHPEMKDETYGIINGIKGPMFFKEFSICEPSELGTVV